MSKNNREELKDRLRKIKSDIAIFDRPEAKDSVWMVSAIEALLKESEVTTESGADVCEWEEVSYKTFANCKDYYIDIPDWIPSEDLKTCLFCGKPITIKGE